MSNIRFKNKMFDIFIFNDLKENGIYLQEHYKKQPIYLILHYYVKNSNNY
jgi:hypothetical protein